MTNTLVVWVFYRGEQCTNILIVKMDRCSTFQYWSDHVPVTGGDNPSISYVNKLLRNEMHLRHRQCLFV